jgi:hypothetical protein
MMNLVQIGETYPTWTADTTQSVAMPVSFWVPFGLAAFAIYPADSQGGNEILVTGIAEPPLLENLSDTISIPNEQAEALDRLCVNVLTLKETATVLQQSFEEYRAFQRQVKKIKMWQGLAQPSLWNPEGRQAGKL